MSSTEYDFLTGEVCEFYRNDITTGDLDELVETVVDYFKENNPDVPIPGLLAAVTDYIRATYENDYELEDGFLYEVVFINEENLDRIITYRSKVGEKKFRKVEYNPEYFDRYGFSDDEEDIYKLLSYYLVHRDEDK